MLTLLKTLLKQVIDRIEAGNCSLTIEDEHKIIYIISNIMENNPRMSKILSCDYLGISRSTFDEYVRNGWIPKGIKEIGFKELSWNKYDLDKYLNEHTNAQ